MQLDRLNRKLEGLEKASKNGHRVKDLYRMMYLPEIWQEAYANIYSNKGALTRGVDDVTLDGMSHERIDNIIEKLKAGKHNLEHWQKVLIARNRKTMILCSGTPDSCHFLLHAGKLPDKRFSSKWI